MMNYKTLILVAITLSIVVIAGCGNAESRYSSSYYNPQAGNPPPAAAGCGVAAPSDMEQNEVQAVMSVF